MIIVTNITGIRIVTLKYDARTAPNKRLAVTSARYPMLIVPQTALR
jgi:hypothetical protein